MYDLIEVNEERCIGCNTCIRVCPSPEANIVKRLENGKTVTAVDNSKCIACGECVKVCRAKARDYEDDTEKFFKDLNERNIVVVAHPSIKTAFPGTWQAVLKWFKQNGAKGIYDGANGADICTWGYVRSVEQGSIQHTLSSHCPAIVKYMELYHPGEVKLLSPIHSPISCEAVYIRDYIKKNYAVAALTPCPAMKLEFEETGHAEYNVTFKRLKEYFHRKRIDFGKALSDDQKYDFDDQLQGCMGGIFPSPGGLRYNLSINIPDISAISSDGAATVYSELDEYVQLPPDRRPRVFEALSCSGGCGCGCGIGNDGEQSVLEVKSIMREVEIDARDRRKTTLNGIDKQFKVFDDRINPRSLLRHYETPEKLVQKPSEKELESVYVMMGKVSEYDRKIDCGACGYRTCAEMVDAVYFKRNVPENCIMCAKKAAPAEAVAPVSDVPEAAETEPAYAEETYTEAAAETAPYAYIDNARATELADRICGFANNLLADIENIYASLHGIDESNQKSASMSEIVVNILDKVIGFCESVDSIDSDNLPMLVSTLEKLQNAVASLNENVNSCVTDSSTIREAMQSVADATTELNAAANEMCSAVSGSDIL